MRPRREELHQDRIDALTTERKYVTILRADLHRSSVLVVDLELEQAIDRLAPAMEEMRASVHAHGGIVYRELGDGIFAVFGAPVADDLHAVMACVAALDLLRRIEALHDAGLKVRIGVHSGQVVAGPKRLDFSSTYEFDGPPLIMAERLQSDAEPGRVLASATTRTLADGYIRFAPATERTLKGFSRPVPVHAVEGVAEMSRWRVSAARRGTPFVGRDGETARLLELAKNASDKNRGTCVAIVGEAGVGKSRLVRDCIQTLRSRGWQTITAECSPILGNSPFALLKAVLSDVAASLGAGTLKGLQKSLPPVQSAALEVMLWDGTHRPAWANLSPLARGRSIVAASRAVVAHHVKGHPTVVLLEDLQWADEASVPAMQAILAMAEQQALLVLGTARTTALPAWFVDAAAVTRRLPTLARPAGLAMLDQMLGPSIRLARLKQRILDHTGGMPLFLEEVCRRLVETGTLAGDWGAFEPTVTTTDLGVPLTVQGVIASRIDRLAPPVKRMLQIAAAIGPHVPIWLMKSVAAVPDSVFRSALGALSGAAMLVPAPRSTDPPAGSRDFTHELVRQVAYDAVLGQDRIALHSRILATLEEMPDGEPRHDLAGALAHHALIAQEWAKAAQYAAAIARQSFAQSALPDATRHYESAMQALDRLPASTDREAKAIDLRIEARLAYANVGNVSRWLDLAKEAEARSAAIGDDVRKAAALAVRAAALNFCGAPKDALETGAQAVAQATRCRNPGWLAYAEYGLGQACYIAGRYQEGVEHFKQAHQRFAIGGAKPPVGGSGIQAGLLCCMMACLCHIALGEEAAAADVQRTANETAAQEGRPLAAIAAAYSQGALLLHQDRTVEAEAALSQALTLAKRHEVNLFVPVIACQLGLTLLLLGRAPEARQTLDLARAEADALGHRSASVRADIYRVLSDAVLADGRATQLQALQAVTRTARQQGYDPLELEALLLAAALHRLAGEETLGAGCAATAEDVAARSGAEGTLRDFREYLRRLLGSAGS